MGYLVIPTFADSGEDFPDIFNLYSWDLIVCLESKAGIISSRVVPLLSDCPANLPWLAICDKVDKADVFSAIDAGCVDIINTDDLAKLEEGMYRLSKEKAKNLENKSIRKRIVTEKERVSLTLSSIGDGVITVDEQQRITMINGAAEEITGWASSNALGRPLAEIFNIVDQNTGKSMYDLVHQSIQTGDILGLKQDTVLISREGLQKYLSASIAPIKVSNNTIGLVIVFRDITCIRRTEKKLLAEQQKMKLLSSTIPIGIILIDNEGIVRKANTSALDLLGKHKEEMVGKVLGSGLKWPYDRQEKRDQEKKNCIEYELWKIYNDNMTLQTGEEPLITELFFASADIGSPNDIWLKINSATLKINGLTNVVLAIDDVTGMKIAEETMGRYRLLSEHANDIIIFFDFEGKIIEANKAASTFYGYTEKEMLEREIGDLLSPVPTINLKAHTSDNSGGIPNSILELYRQIGGGIFHEALGRKKNGRTFFIEVSLQSAEIAGKKIILSIQRDISERKRVLEELETARKRAEAANLAKSKFLANMSHEIRTPLNGMLGMIDLTLLTDLTEGQRENLYIAKECAATLLSLINDILDFSKVEAGKLVMEEANFDLKEFMEVLLRSHMLAAHKKGLQFEYFIDRAIPPLLNGDSNRLKQIINNLVDNAIKFTDMGGVKVSVNMKKRVGDNLELLFTVADTGIGIEDKDLQKIFGTFSQADNSITRKYGGSGLGLAISKQLVKLMGGKIWVKSKQGQGSNFYFTLTLPVGKGGLCQQDAVPAIKKTNKPMKILLVEDDRVNQVVLTRMIEKAGHEVKAVGNGLAALKIIKTYDFDLILMDIQMPGMDGIETAKRIRKEENGEARMPIVAITAYALEGDREKYLAAGMDEYIAKPVDISNLLAVIEKLGKKNERIGVEEYSGSVEDFYSFLIRKEIEGRPEKNKSGALEKTPVYVEALKRAFRERDFSSVEKNAHIIKSLATEAGLIALRQKIFKVELKARKKDIEGLNKYIPLFFEEFEKYKLE